jgi:hypothetical protein
VDELTSWSKDLTVEIAGHDVINHTGAAVLRIIADRSGLTSGLSRPGSFRCMIGAGCWLTLTLRIHGDLAGWRVVNGKSAPDLGG